jgi:hypothetical protein
LQNLFADELGGAGGRARSTRGDLGQVEASQIARGRT